MTGSHFAVLHHFKSMVQTSGPFTGFDGLNLPPAIAETATALDRWAAKPHRTVAQIVAAIGLEIALIDAKPIEQFKTAAWNFMQAASSKIVAGNG